jgi:hypothetical protein
VLKTKSELIRVRYNLLVWNVSTQCAIVKLVARRPIYKASPWSHPSTSLVKKSTMMLIIILQTLMRRKQKLNICKQLAIFVVDSCTTNWI